MLPVFIQKHVNEIFYSLKMLAIESASEIYADDLEEGPDGGEPDGGEPDGGEPDGGEPDGGEPDGGGPFGGLPDSDPDSPLGGGCESPESLDPLLDVEVCTGCSGPP